MNTYYNCKSEKVIYPYSLFTFSSSPKIQPHFRHQTEMFLSFLSSLFLIPSFYTPKIAWKRWVESNDLTMGQSHVSNPLDYAAIYK